VRLGHAERPGRKPPDLPLAKLANSEVAVAREPEKVPGHGEEEEHREQVRFAGPRAIVELGHVQEEEDARHQAEVVARHRLAEPATDSRAVPAPGRQLLGPAVGSLDLDLEVREDEGDEEEVRPHRKGHGPPAGRYSRSMMVAIPCPKPMHIVWSP